MIFSLFISCPKGLEYLLEEELRPLGLQKMRVSPQGVYGEGTLALLYRLCLWSRLANRVQVILFHGPVRDQHMLYALCHQYPWETVFEVNKTFSIEFHGASTDIRHSMFGAQVVKDGIVDYFRALNETRPTIDRERPDIRLHAYLKNEELTVSFDLTGYSLHQRGYRLKAGMAPLKENVAVAMLLRAKWPTLVDAGFALHDPCCGSGTLVIEAAMMAARMAPGLIRQDQSFHHWVQHEPLLWDELREEARQQIKPPTVQLSGSDIDARLIELAQANALSAGVASWVDFNTKPLLEGRPRAKQGLLIANPPYGERLGDEEQWMPLYQEIGQVLHAHYQGWQAAILTSNPSLAKAIGLRATKQYTLYNGALACKLYSMTIDASNQLKEATTTSALSASAEMFQNRLQKNHLHLQKWARRNQMSCYRVYDADLPEYAYAIDIYNDYAVLQEYVAPATVAPDKIAARSADVLNMTPKVLGIDPAHIVVKQRKPQKGTHQYQKISQLQRTMVVQEGGALFKVNLYDYLDTGLFLDHRPLRLKFATLPAGTRFLNCFCYTATASVHAALGGALTTNVDLSNTYLAWAEDNFKLNQLDLSKHQFVQYDCLAWLKLTRDRFDVIFLDPPSFSNSKSMTTTLDIQRDHESLINTTVSLLTPAGVLYFSTNARHFKLSPQISQDYWVVDISATTIDIDFKRNQRIHQCFMIRRKTG